MLEQEITGPCLQSTFFFFSSKEMNVDGGPVLSDVPTLSVSSALLSKVREGVRAAPKEKEQYVCTCDSAEQTVVLAGQQCCKL